MTTWTGKVLGTVREHTSETLARTFERAYVVLTTETGLFEGRRYELSNDVAKRPTVLFLHGSSGINPATKELARRLAYRGYAFIAPDSMTTEGRITYTSPIDPKIYEEIHAMRAEELRFAAMHLMELPFFDGRFAVAGTSEGGVSVARFSSLPNTPEAARLIFSWSCEDNYHVTAHRTNIPESIPVLNVMSTEDKFFSHKNSYLGNDTALGHAGRTLANHPDATIVLLNGAPHTLFNLPQAATLIDAFLARVFA